MAGGLASPPNTCVNSPIGPLGLASTSQTHCSLRFLNPRAFHTDCVEVDDDATVFDRSRPSSPFGDDNSTIVDESMNPLEIMQEDGAGELKELQSHPQEDESRNPLKITQEGSAGKSMELRSHPQEDESRNPLKITQEGSAGKSTELRSHPQDDEPLKITQEDGAGKSMELPSHPQEDDSTMVDVESRLSPPPSPYRLEDALKVMQEDGAGDDDSPMDGVESRPPSPHQLEDALKIMPGGGPGDVELRPPSPHQLELPSHPQKDDSTMVDVESTPPSSSLSDGNSTMVDQSTIALKITPEDGPRDDDSPMDGVESRPPSPQLLLDDANEDDVEGLSMNEDKSSDALGKSFGTAKATTKNGESNGSSSCQLGKGFHIKGFGYIKATPKPAVDFSSVVGALNGSSSDGSYESSSDESTGSSSVLSAKASRTAKAKHKNIESSVMAALGPRRSSRILSSKNKPIVDHAPPRKPTRGKKKAPFENDVVLAQANIHIFESDSEDELPQLSGLEKATVGLIFHYYLIIF